MNINKIIFSSSTLLLLLFIYGTSSGIISKYNDSAAQRFFASIQPEGICQLSSFICVRKHTRIVIRRASESKRTSEREKEKETVIIALFLNCYDDRHIQHAHSFSLSPFNLSRPVSHNKLY
jgi:hypothetical protein